MSHSHLKIFSNEKVVTMEKGTNQNPVDNQNPLFEVADCGRPGGFLRRKD